MIPCKADPTPAGCRAGRAAGYPVGDEELAEAFAFADRRGFETVALVFEQQQRAVGAQYCFDGALPGRIGDFGDLGERDVSMPVSPEFCVKAGSSVSVVGHCVLSNCAGLM